METKEVCIFVYGSLQSGGVLNSHIANHGGTFVGDGVILNKNFIMRDLGAFPALQPVDSGTGDYIHGEIWLVNVECLRDLDIIEGYPHYYDRKMVPVWHGKTPLKCWTYYMDFEVASDGRKSWIVSQSIVQSGEWDAAKCGPVPGYQSREVIEITDETEESEEPKVKASFTVERGVYLTTDWGESYGPFQSIDEAMTIFHDMTEEFGDDVEAITVGFRMVNDNVEGTPTNDTGVSGKVDRYLEAFKAEDDSEDEAENSYFQEYEYDGTPF